MAAYMGFLAFLVASVSSIKYKVLSLIDKMVRVSLTSCCIFLFLLHRQLAIDEPTRRPSLWDSDNREGNHEPIVLGQFRPIPYCLRQTMA